MTNLPQTLQFQDKELTIVDQNGQPWLASRDLANALGYNDEGNVNRIYERNSEEFCDAMTCKVKLTSQGQNREIRIFSPRGCHLIAMLSHTKKAKDFRKWVLDVLEQHGQLPATSDDKALVTYNKIRSKEFAEFVCDAVMEKIREEAFTAKVYVKDKGEYVNPATSDQAGKLFQILRDMDTKIDQLKPLPLLDAPAPKPKTPDIQRTLDEALRVMLDKFDKIIEQKTRGLIGFTVKEITEATRSYHISDSEKNQLTRMEEHIRRVDMKLDLNERLMISAPVTAAPRKPWYKRLLAA